jgi:VanZ family protein
MFLAITWLITVTVLLTLPGSAFPKEKWLEVYSIDKWIHIALFGALSFLWCWAIKNTYGKKLRHFFIIAMVVLAYGIMMEFVQKYWIPNRSFDLGDIAGDGVGSFAGVGLAVLTLYKKNRPL